MTDQQQQQPNSRLVMTMLALGITMLLWNFYIQWKYGDEARKKEQNTAETQSPVDQSTASTATGEATPTDSSTPAVKSAEEGDTTTEIVKQTIAKLPAESLTIETDVASWQFSQELGGIEQITLHKYKESSSPDSGPVKLLNSPMLVHGGTSTIVPRNMDYEFAASREGRTLRMWRNEGPFKITQEFQIPDKGYSATLRVTYENTDSKSNELNASLKLIERVNYATTGGFIPGMPMARPTITWKTSQETDFEDIEGACGDLSEAISAAKGANIDYIGYDFHYFLASFQPKEKNLDYTVNPLSADENGCSVLIGMSLPYGMIKPGEVVSIQYDGFFGPKDLEILTETDAGLENTVDYGMFAFIAKPLLIALHGSHSVTGNYGIDIILLTLLLKILFYPLVKSSSTSMHKMKKLSPQMNEIKEKFKDDRQRQQQEMMKFWQAHQINPMKGCLPILPQIPVFFAFYQMLRCSIELRQADFFGWIHDLSIADPYYVTPILMGVAMFAQQRLTPTAGMDKTQEKVMMFMPVMFTAMMLSLPAGMTLYMLVNTVVSIAQQKWLYNQLDKQEA